MKLILREYLASLKERKELDALLPDLLSQMGLEVFSRPDIGGRQYGVDIAAYGSIDGNLDAVYLLSVKSGDLGRNDWEGNSVQSLKPSLGEILDVYIPTHLPPAYKDKPIVICLCFGGEVKETVRLNVSQYENKNKTDQISFSEWNGDVIAGYIENYLLREELLPENCRPLLRKSLALLDEPQASYKYFNELVRTLAAIETTKPEEVLTILRQINLCLWILYVWCRDQDNIETAYQSSELVTLLAWDLSKPFFDGRKKTEVAIIESLWAIEDLHIQIAENFMENIVFPFANKFHALSSAVSPSCSLDINLKLFDILGRVALSGLWSFWQLERIPSVNSTKQERSFLTEKIEKHRVAIVQILVNNPILFSPYKDDQAIDISIVLVFLDLTHSKGDIHSWLYNVMQSCLHLFGRNGNYPCNLQAYHELIEHPMRDSETYLEEVTTGSILYPLIATVSAIYNFDDIYDLVRQVKNNYLKHCNFQAWYPDSTTEEHFYTDSDLHGATLSDLDVNKGKKDFLKDIFRDCDAAAHFDDLSGVVYQSKPFPIILMACRHYRVPVPMHLFKNIYERHETS